MSNKKDEQTKPVLNNEQVMERLKTIKYPGFSRDIVSFGIIKELSVEDSSIKVRLHIPTQDPKMKEQIIMLIRDQLESMPEVKTVDLEIDEAVSQPSHAPAGEKAPKLLQNIKYKIAVASGKGGVGKSTVAVNLALALAKRGAKVGLLDADIYGPNIPIMLGTFDPPKGMDGKVLPVKKYGIKLISIGFFVDSNDPIIWRGPLVGKAIEQLMRDVTWEDLDYFIVDMPPGTGDAQISLSSLIDLSGTIMVSTPQDVALADVIKGVRMFQKVNVDILGLVENMSYFICPHCNERTEIFAHGTTQKTCEKYNLPYLGDIPLDSAIRIGGDAGKPIIETHADSPQAQAFYAIADRILKIMTI